MDDAAASIRKTKQKVWTATQDKTIPEYEKEILDDI